MKKNCFSAFRKLMISIITCCLLIVDIADYANSRIEIARQKMIPTREDLNPNTKFVDNLIIQQIAYQQATQSVSQYHALSWVNTPELIKKLHNRIRMAPFFKEYMEHPQQEF